MVPLKVVQYQTTPQSMVFVCVFIENSEFLLQIDTDTQFMKKYGHVAHSQRGDYYKKFINFSNFYIFHYFGKKEIITKITFYLGFIGRKIFLAQLLNRLATHLNSFPRNSLYSPTRKEFIKNGFQKISKFSALKLNIHV